MATNLLGYGLPDTYPVVIDGYPRSVVVGHFLFHIEARNILTFGAVLAVLAGILLFVFFLRVPRYQKKSVLWLAAACTFFGYTVWAIIAWRDMVTGLVSTMPLLGFSLAYVNAGADNSDSHTVYQFAWYTVMIYLAGMLSFWPAFGAKLWGSRYLLSAYPLLLFLAFYAVAAYHSRLPALLQKTLHLTFWLLLVIAVGLQFLGWRFNYVTIQALAAERDAVQALPADVFLPNLTFWSPLVSSIDDRPFFYIEPDSEIDSLLRRLYAHGWRRIAVISLESEPLTLANDVDGLEIRRISPFIYQLQSH
ncbi:MAG: hypothetical protein ACE5EY_16940 [Anaerolineae bacterium]